MSNVVYLKSNNNFNEVFICYSYKDLKSVTTYKDCGMTKSFNDIDEFNFSIQNDLKNLFVLCDKSEFDQALKKFEDTLNEIKNQL